MNEMLEELQLRLRRMEGKSSSATPEIWHQVMLVLITQLRRKRCHCSLEATLPDRILRLIVAILPKALPQLLQMFSFLWTPAVQAQMLLHPDLRQHMDKFILVDVSDNEGQQGGDDPSPSPATDAVLNNMFLLLVQSVMRGSEAPPQCQIRSRRICGQIASQIMLAPKAHNNHRACHPQACGRG
mmetsp:Transcript_137122/g.292892  ORF Transcript_137122/g.292892 Transcript_137122/m.292892 type:complete len:184 (-) Transcript_137122:221-772(-)|eukprot:CAMPEP_0180420006 /NCGR_PEP_ID=MMETSP1036_2-20121128/2408_1 /TAXON_ID=632150 /ORGANISM="Azadinium spinosum, Strain 3D9" /LENGTH=183 /DNA_ID=CAMNT_0022425217 /DNA_START=73 /DNA_END=624 /DNA_ORIENTATION=+